MSVLPNIPIEDYNYELPEEMIAQSAAEPRDSSKLLVYRNGKIDVSVFNQASTFLDDSMALYFNNAKVIPARLFLKNSNGANIEVFLLQPYRQDHGTALNSSNSTTWECLIGNSKKWKSDETLSLDVEDFEVSLKRLESNVVEFNWSSGVPFSRILENIGNMPLPPYIKHEANDYDNNRYQTIYSKIEGSVAAPTAGLHFTDDVLDSIRRKNISMNFVTLHVGAGTFMPVKVENASEHPMHKEFFEIDRSLIEQLIQGKKVIAVGTTSCRVLESIYYLGLNLRMHVDQFQIILQFPYLNETADFDVKSSLEAILDYMERENLQTIKGSTSIMITPGYRFKFCKGIITNFHQPKSTLLLLISAFVGDNWKSIYEAAKSHDFRFLSYGDSSLLLP